MEARSGALPVGICARRWVRSDLPGPWRRWGPRCGVGTAAARRSSRPRATTAPPRGSGRAIANVACSSSPSTVPVARRGFSQKPAIGPGLDPRPRDDGVVRAVHHDARLGASVGEVEPSKLALHVRWARGGIPERQLGIGHCPPPALNVGPKRGIESRRYDTRSRRGRETNALQVSAHVQPSRPRPLR